MEAADRTRVSRYNISSRRYSHTPAEIEHRRSSATSGPPQSDKADKSELARDIPSVGLHKLETRRKRGEGAVGRNGGHYSDRDAPAGEGCCETTQPLLITDITHGNTTRIYDKLSVRKIGFSGTFNVLPDAV